LGPVLHGAGILAPNVLWGELDVAHGGADVSMSHQLLQGRQGDSVANHIGSKAVSKPVGISTEDCTA